MTKRSRSSMYQAWTFGTANGWVSRIPLFRSKDPVSQFLHVSWNAAWCIIHCQGQSSSFLVHFKWTGGQGKVIPATACGHRGFKTCRWRPFPRDICHVFVDFELKERQSLDLKPTPSYLFLRVVKEDLLIFQKIYIQRLDLWEVYIFFRYSGGFQGYRTSGNVVFVLCLTSYFSWMVYLKILGYTLFRCPVWLQMSVNIHFIIFHHTI